MNYDCYFLWNADVIAVVVIFTNSIPQALGLFRKFAHTLGSGPRYMIRVTLFCTLRESENTVEFSHVRASVFSDSRNVQKRATKSDTSGHCLPYTIIF